MLDCRLRGCRFDCGCTASMQWIWPKLFTHVLLYQVKSIICYWLLMNGRWFSAAWKLTAVLAESNDSLLSVSCWLVAYRLGLSHTPRLVSNMESCLVFSRPRCNGWLHHILVLFTYYGHLPHRIPTPKLVQSRLFNVIESWHMAVWSLFPVCQICQIISNLSNQTSYLQHLAYSTYIHT